jgi:transcriptional regulator with XRE-family HTH domain
MATTASFGYWVRRQRLALDLTQAALAAQVGCATITIRKIEREERRPSRQMAEQLATCLAIPAADRETFIQCGLGQLPVDALPLPTEPQPQPAGAAGPSLPPFLTTPEEEAGDNGPTRFVAREPELAQLDGHLAAALEGNGRVVFITGDSGRGKTSLLAEFARRAQAGQPDLIVAGGAGSTYANIGDPYLPFRELLSLLTGDVEARLAARSITHEQALRLWQLPRLPSLCCWRTVPTCSTFSWRVDRCCFVPKRPFQREPSSLSYKRLLSAAQPAWNRAAFSVNTPTFCATSARNGRFC